MGIKTPGSPAGGRVPALIAGDGTRARRLPWRLPECSAVPAEALGSGDIPGQPLHWLGLSEGEDTRVCTRRAHTESTHT